MAVKAVSLLVTTAWGYAQTEPRDRAFVVCSMLRGDPIRSRVLNFLLLVAAGCAAYYFFIYLPRHRRPVEMVYVLPHSLEVVDTAAEVRMVIAVLKGGERVEVVARNRNWAQVKLRDGRKGWVGSEDLLDAATYEAGQKLLRDLVDLPAQAAGHAAGVVNLRLGPSRGAVQLAQLPVNDKVEIFGRRLVERPPQPDQPPISSAPEAWYLIRTDSRAGWVLGRFVALDIPEALSSFAQGTNLVGWLVLDTVVDNGQRIPQYLVADRAGTQDVDFNHIRVLTWWMKRHRYATAYVEGHLNGYFPIRVLHVNGVPHFRLRLIDKDGHKVQKVYGVFDTITRPLGLVDGWESDAMPTQPMLRRRRHR